MEECVSYASATTSPVNMSARRAFGSGIWSLESGIWSGIPRGRRLALALEFGVLNLEWASAQPFTIGHGLRPVASPRAPGCRKRQPYHQVGRPRPVAIPSGLGSCTLPRAAAAVGRSQGILPRISRKRLPSPAGGNFGS